MAQHRDFSGSDADWALHAKAVLDRIRRSVEAGIDEAYRLLQPHADAMGKAIQADDWAVRLFSEEVVRGRTAFVLSTLMRQLDPVLRQWAHLGDWQVISPSQVTGYIEVVESL